MKTRTCIILSLAAITSLGFSVPALNAEPWTPAELNTELWLDAADEGTITKNGSDLVSQWDDKSGNDRHVSEAGDDDKPIYEATGFNGGTMPSLYFPDPGGAHNGRVLVHALAAELPASEWVLFVVINDQSDETDAAENMLLAAPAGGFHEHRVWLGNQGTSIRSDSGNGGSAKAPNVIGEQQIYFSLSGTSSEVVRNGTQVSVSDGTYVNRPIVTRISVGARGNTGHAGINGKISEYILMSEVPSTEDRQKMEGYLAHKWGLAGDLPNDHPYKGAAPGVVVVTFPLTITSNASNPGNYDFEWDSHDDKLYDLVSETGLTTALAEWPVWNGHADITSGGATTSLLNVPGIDSTRYFAVIEKEPPPPPPLLNEGFEGDNGSFTSTVTAGTDWAWGPPMSTGDNGTQNAGGAVTEGNNSSNNCWGTSISNPGYYADPTTDSCLRSPDINLAGLSAAQLTFAEALDVEDGDSAVLKLINAVGDAEIAIIYTAIDGDLTSADWADANNGNPIDLSAGIGNTVYLQWCLSGTGGDSHDFMGWYIDDVVVTGN